MSLLKNITTASIAGVLLFSLSCDDRLPSESETAVETGSLELSYVFVDGPTSNPPIIVGEVLSAPDSRTRIVVIARLLDSEGNGVNNKSLQFSASGVSGSFDTTDPSTKYVANYKEFGFPDLVGNGYTYAIFTPDNGEERIETNKPLLYIISFSF